MLTNEEYATITRKMCVKLRKTMSYTRNIDYQTLYDLIMNGLLQADWHYDETRGATKETFRYTMAVWSVQHFFGRVSSHDREYKKAVSLNYEYATDENRTTSMLERMGIIDKSYEAINFKDFVDTALKNHSRLRRLFEMRYMLRMNFDEISKAMKLSRERVRQLLNNLNGHMATFYQSS